MTIEKRERDPLHKPPAECLSVCLPQAIAYSFMGGRNKLARRSTKSTYVNTTYARIGIRSSEWPHSLRNALAQTVMAYDITISPALGLDRPIAIVGKEGKREGMPCCTVLLLVQEQKVTIAKHTSPNRAHESFCHRGRGGGGGGGSNFLQKGGGV